MTALNFGVRINNRGPYSGTMEMVTDMVDAPTVNGHRAPNLAWEFVDETGHFHAWTKDGKLPTLDRVVKEHVPCFDPEGCACEGYDVYMYACRICAEEVEPETTVDYSRQVLPGRSWWEATVDVPGETYMVGDRVSLAFSVPDAQVRYFGIARVVGQDITGDSAGIQHRLRLAGEGELGRRK